MSDPGVSRDRRRRDVQRGADAETRREARHRGAAPARREPRHRGTAEARRQAERLEAAGSRLEARHREAEEIRLEDERFEAEEARLEAERLEAAASRRAARSQGLTRSRRGVRSRGAEAQGEVRHRALATPMLRESVIVIGLALVVSLLVKTWLLQAFFIPTGSMENTLVKDDRVIVNKMVPSWVTLKRGDIIVFVDPGGWLPAVPPTQHSRLSTALTFVGLLPSDEGNHLIKRVIGLPGDHVVCCDQNKQITVNGAAVTEPYLKAGDIPSQEPFKITVPAGRVWVMGDHRSDSGDSRPHDENSGGAKGSVPESLIVGRAVALVWPREHWTWLSNPSATFAGVPAP